MEWKVFFKLWSQKILRNVGSIKVQVLMTIVLITSYGMFSGHWTDDGRWESKINATAGCGLLGASFVTLAGTRIFAKTRLHSDNDEYYEGETDVDDS